MKNLICGVLVTAILFSIIGCGRAQNYSYLEPDEYQAGIILIDSEDESEDDSYDIMYDAELSPQDDNSDWRNAPTTPNEEYARNIETGFVNTRTSPLSTFSSSVNTASYSNMRRFIHNGAAPMGVRIEELVNYFNYDYPKPRKNSSNPFTINAEVGECPWNKDNLLAKIGIQGESLQEKSPNNIVFLIDVSGSMNTPNKMPLLKESFKLLIENLDEKDRISIVTYAGNEKTLADSIPGDQHNRLNQIINSLRTGGTTAGAQALRSAYALAEKNFIKDGNNRIVLATDGDFNVGESDINSLIDLVEQKRNNGVFISVLGYGMGNLKDDMMEAIANHGNGNYAYIDNIQEARKVLSDEFDGAMYVIAKDLKIQIEFNPATVQSYRLIGYNNRRLSNEEFIDDQKDAGDVGAGHSVTAFYEIVPQDGDGGSDDLKYQTITPTGSDDYMTIKVRYKRPNDYESRLTEMTVTKNYYTRTPSQNFVFASAVAEFGLILTDSNYMGNANLTSVVYRADRSKGEDSFGLRQEFVELVKKYKQITD
ncbi:MAG: VWA domain-containing protein [Oscillospiraceae bacterium]|nr:VWA domain-containing protein [Oscillospiraceae bacterium]